MPRVNRVGAAASVALGDVAVLSAWHVAAANAEGVLSGGSGMRLATVPNTSGVVLAAMASRPCCGSSSSGDGSGATAAAASSVCELSASVPVADGILITPGLVMARQSGRTAFALAMQSTWRF